MHILSLTTSCKFNWNEQHYGIALTNEVILQASIFYELCDNAEGLISSAHRIQSEQILMLKRLQDFYLCLNIWADDCKVQNIVTIDTWHMIKKHFRCKIDISQTHLFWIKPKTITYLWWHFSLNVPRNSLIATSIILFHTPCHTSPNSPLPSFFTLVRELRLISHWSSNDRLGRDGLSSWK